MMIKPSRIHGLGCFAKKDYTVGEIISFEVLPQLEKAPNEDMKYLDNYGKMGSLIGSDWRYLNHRHNNNAEWWDSKDTEGLLEDEYILIAILPIKKNEEININYRIKEFN